MVLATLSVLYADLGTRPTPRRLSHVSYRFDAPVKGEMRLQWLSEALTWPPERQDSEGLTGVLPS